MGRRDRSNKSNDDLSRTTSHDCRMSPCVFSFIDSSFSLVNTILPYRLDDEYRHRPRVPFRLAEFTALRFPAFSAVINDLRLAVALVGIVVNALSVCSAMRNVACMSVSGRATERSCTRSRIRAQRACRCDIRDYLGLISI